jgi:hypothetical protein
MPPRSRATAAKILAAVQAVGAGLSQRKASERYDVPKSTLQRALRANAGEGGGAEPEEADRTGPPDHRTGPDRTTPNQTPRAGENWQAVSLALAGDERLEPTHMQAAAMMVAGHTLQQTSEATGISSRTLSRRKGDPVFLSVMADMRTACHMRARERLARGAEVAVEAFAEGAALQRELNRTALELLAEAREDPSKRGQALDAVKLAIDASRLTPQGKALTDAGGFPKTERSEVVVSSVDMDAARDDDELLAELEALQPTLRVIKGGQ